MNSLTGGGCRYRTYINRRRPDDARDTLAQDGANLMTSAHTTEMRTNYEPQSDAATGRMLASATGMAAALSCGCVFAAIVSALFPRLS